MYIYSDCFYILCMCPHTTIYLSIYLSIYLYTYYIIYVLRYIEIY